LSTFYQV